MGGLRAKCGSRTAHHPRSLQEGRWGRACSPRSLLGSDLSVVLYPSQSAGRPRPTERPSTPCPLGQLAGQ